MKRLLLASLFLPTAVLAAPSCMPTLYGNPTGSVQIQRNSLGWYGYWYCKQPDSSISGTTWWCLHGVCTPDSASSNYYGTVKGDGDPPTKAKSMWDSLFTSNCATATGNEKTLCETARTEMLANAPVVAPVPIPPPVPPPPPPPPADVYVVQKNIFSVNIAVYSVVAGKRGPAISGLFVHAGDPCNPTTTITEGTVKYMGVAGRLDAIAPCVKQ